MWLFRIGHFLKFFFLIIFITKDSSPDLKLTVESLPMDCLLKPKSTLV